MKKVVIPLAEGFEEIEGISIIDVLRRAEIQVITVSITDDYSVTGSHEITILADDLIGNIDFRDVEMIILPGGMPGTINLNRHEGLKNEILRLHREGKLVGAICAAPMILGQLGLLERKEATCYPGFERYLSGAEITGKTVVLADNIITGKGAGVATDFALHIVELLKGRKTALELAAKLINTTFQ